MSRLSDILVRVGASHESFTDRDRAERRQRNLAEMQRKLALLNRKTDDAFARVITQIGYHPEHRSVEQAERAGLIYLDHACTSISPCERGVLLYGDPDTGSMFAFPYVAR